MHAEKTFYMEYTRTETCVCSAYAVKNARKQHLLICICNQHSAKKYIAYKQQTTDSCTDIPDHGCK